MWVQVLYIDTSQSVKTLVGDASQDGAKQLPYKNISQYGIQISGLPAGITLKNPSAYGPKQCWSIIEHKDRLTQSL